MIKGVGTDILEINRMEKLVDNNKFMSTYYTQKELSYIMDKANRAETAAATFCAKEAVAKAIGTGFVGFLPRDIEIDRDERGRPTVVLYDRAKKTAEEFGITKIHVSLTQCRNYAAAFAADEGVD